MDGQASFVCRHSGCIGLLHAQLVDPSASCVLVGYIHVYLVHCLQPLVAKMYKALLPLQSKLGFQLGEVKSCISLAPLCPFELNEAMQSAVMRVLCEGAWTALDKYTVISCDFLQAQAGVVSEAMLAKFEVSVQHPHTIMLLMKKAGNTMCVV